MDNVTECLMGREEIDEDKCWVCRNPAGTCPYLEDEEESDDDD
jgi:NAD-dependent dihydropyrimidine dehydrogenase PreA subunit